MTELTTHCTCGTIWRTTTHGAPRPLRRLEAWPICDPGTDATGQEEDGGG